MRLACDNYDQISVVSLKGELTAEEVQRFRQAALDRMERDRIRDFVLDCADLEFVDSQGLEALLWLQEQCAQRLGQVRLAACRDNVLTILQITRLISRFDLHPDAPAALKSLR